MRPLRARSRRLYWVSGEGVCGWCVCGLIMRIGGCFPLAAALVLLSATGAAFLLGVRGRPRCNSFPSVRTGGQRPLPVHALSRFVQHAHRDRQTASDPHAASGFPVSSTICLASPLVGSRHPHQQQQPLPSASDAPQCSAAEPKTCTTPPLPPSTVRSHPYNHPPPPPALLPSPPKRRWGGHRRRGTLKIRTGSGPGKSSGTTPAPGTCQWPTRRP